MQNTTRLNGWKAIARHLGRSERTIQLWEASRGLPVHRIPGSKGWTVFAYVGELDRWITGGPGRPSIAPEASRDGSSPTKRPSARKPGLLVLPFDRRSQTTGGCDIEAYAEDLIAHFAATQPSMRVLSSTTSRMQRDRSTTLATLSHELGVRYLVEGSVSESAGCRQLHVRIVDAEIDSVLLVSRFASSRADDASFRAMVVRGVVEHFSLVLAGALVEPLYPHQIDPEAYLHYLETVRLFTEGTGDATRRALRAIDRSLVVDAGFAPAHALRGLVHLQVAALNEEPCADGRVGDALETARAIADTFAGNRAAGVTGAFLDAALAIAFDADRERAESRLSKALMAMPESVASRGRLYDRRSTKRDADGHSFVGEGRRRVEASRDGRDDVPHRPSHNLFANVMRAMTGLHRVSGVAHPRMDDRRLRTAQDFA